MGSADVAAAGWFILKGLLDAGFSVAPGERYRIQSGPALRISTATLPTSEAARLAETLAASARPQLASHLA